MHYVVYNIVDQRDNQVFDVGVTDDFRSRMAQHIRSRGPVGLRIASMIECGVAPTFNILEQVEGTVEDANRREKYWAQFFTSMGMKLLPGSFVGYGSRVDAGRKHTYQKGEALYQTYLQTGVCPWKSERDYRRKFVAKRENAN